MKTYLNWIVMTIFITAITAGTGNNNINIDEKWDGHIPHMIFGDDNISKEWNAYMANVKYKDKTVINDTTYYAKWEGKMPFPGLETRNNNISIDEKWIGTLPLATYGNDAAFIIEHAPVDHIPRNRNTSNSADLIIFPSLMSIIILILLYYRIK